MPFIKKKIKSYTEQNTHISTTRSKSLYSKYINWYNVNKRKQKKKANLVIIKSTKGLISNNVFLSILFFIITYKRHSAPAGTPTGQKNVYIQFQSQDITKTG